MNELFPKLINDYDVSHRSSGKVLLIIMPQELSIQETADRRRKGWKLRGQTKSSERENVLFTHFVMNHCWNTFYEILEDFCMFTKHFSCLTHKFTSSEQK